MDCSIYELEKQKIKNTNGRIIFDGMSIRYYNNGQIKEKVNYSNDEKNGEIFYDRFGNITNKVVWNDGGEVDFRLFNSTM